MARKQQLINDIELFDAMTVTASSVWGLNSGVIAEDKVADIVVASPKEHKNDIDAFYSLNPEDILLVVQQGKIRLFDDILIAQLTGSNFPISEFSKVTINGTRKYVQGDLPGLISEVQKYHPLANFPVSKEA